MSAATNGQLLEVADLRVHFFTGAGVVKAVDGVSYGLMPGQTLGLVGESGSGKTISSLALLRLIPRPGKIMSGRIMFQQEDLGAKPEKDMIAVRGKQIAMIFQNPAYSLNPIYSIGAQLGEILVWHEKVSQAAARERVTELLRLVGIADPVNRLRQFPHELSGGMKQRVCIARALLCNPALVLAGEPTTNQDVTIQAQILDLLRDLQQKKGLALILITHDLGVVAEMADEVVVMYAGKVVERTSAAEIFSNPKMPYTRALLNSIPTLNQKKRLEAIPGIVPNLLELPKGCRFQERCKFVIDECHAREPELRAIEGKAPHEIRCLRDI